MSRLSSSVRKRAIAQAALTLLARDGVGGFTTSTLARRVGVSEAALFRHFPNLDAILDAAVTELEILLFPEDAAPDEGAPLDDLRSLLGRRAAMLRDRPGVLRILFSHELGRAGTPRTAQRVVALRRRSMAQLTSYLQRAVDDGLVREDVTVKELVSIVYGMILSLVFDVDRAVPGGFESAWVTFLRLVRNEGAGA